ncbi:MAG: hypothetical protein HFJ79_03185 [Clostridiales bacterium]|nr:hypothetical protein [Clostridiales bacterium]
MKLLKTLATLAAFLGCVALIIIGQMNQGAVWLGVMMLGLAGLLVLLFLYNRRYTRADRLAKRKKKEQGSTGLNPR